MGGGNTQVGVAAVTAKRMCSMTTTFIMWGVGGVGGGLGVCCGWVETWERVNDLTHSRVEMVEKWRVETTTTKR